MRTLELPSIPLSHTHASMKSFGAVIRELNVKPTKGKLFPENPGDLLGKSGNFKSPSLRGSNESKLDTSSGPERQGI